MAKKGRPSTFRQETADKICEQLMDGMTLRAICKQEGMPERTTVFTWLQRFPSFQVQYARAREIQADTEVDEIKEIADTPCIGQIVTRKQVLNEDGEVIDGPVEVKEVDMIEHRRLQVDARKWRASKMRPKVYGTVPPDDSPSDGTVRIEGGLPDG